MSVSLLRADNTALANRNVQGIGSTYVDNIKNLINIDKTVPIGENMKDTTCIVAFCEKQSNVIHKPNIHEHNTKDIDLDSEKDLVRI